MRLSELLPEGAELGLAGAGGGTDPEITSLAADSRLVEAGALFAAIPGNAADGGRFAAEAVARGAVALLGLPALAGQGLGVPLIAAAEPRRMLALVAARFSAGQPATAVAVTGTNGKSSVVTFTRQLWAMLGRDAASLGTLGVVSARGERPLDLTTPGPIELHAHLARLAREGVTHVALEASSHALVQHRVDGVSLAAAAFTNLTRDHFDYHGGLEAYRDAKALLFGRVLPVAGVAVLNADDPAFGHLDALAAARGLGRLDYGVAARRLTLLAQRPTEAGQRLDCSVDGRRFTVTSPLIGAFQAHNLLAAAALAIACGEDAEAVMACLGRIEGARGRMERVGTLANGAAVFVDYAHTPDALARALGALRPHTRGALAIVFGAGGDRDPGKRPLMGEAALRHADRAYVTDDNPRSEDPAAIRRAVLEGCPGARDGGARDAAIHMAVAELGPGDVLVIAGKGHETGQTIAGRVLPFDDAAVARRAIAERAIADRAVPDRAAAEGAGAGAAGRGRAA